MKGRGVAIITGTVVHAKREGSGAHVIFGTHVSQTNERDDGSRRDDHFEFHYTRDLAHAAVGILHKSPQVAFRVYVCRYTNGTRIYRKKKPFEVVRAPPKGHS